MPSVEDSEPDRWPPVELSPAELEREAELNNRLRDIENYDTGGVLPALDAARLGAQVAFALHKGDHHLRPEQVAALGGLPALDRLQELARLSPQAAIALHKTTQQARERVSRMLSALDSALIENPAPVVAFGGWKTAGKDEAANTLVREFGYGLTWPSEALHAALVILNPWVRLDLPVWTLEGWKREPGEFMTYAELDYHVGYVEMKKQRDVRERYLQGLGTNVVRNMIDLDAWARLAAEKIRDLRAEHPGVAVTGIRYPNEMAAVREFGAVTVWVNRPGVIAPADSHESELALGPEDFDIVLDNDGDLDHLAGLVRALEAEIRES